MLSATGQFIYAALFALGQFVTPYSDQQIEEFTAQPGLEIWQKRAYQFKPLSPEQIDQLSNRDLATYLRSACIRVFNSSLTEYSIEQGKLENIDFEYEIKLLLTPEKLNEFQKRLLKSEQNIDLTQAVKYLRLACDVQTPLLKLITSHPRVALNYYRQTAASLPQINSAEDLPKLKELSLIKDSKGNVLGEFSLDEVDKNKLVIRRNRRILPKEAIPEILKKSLVAIEDKTFYQHKGVDLKGLLRAGRASASGESVQGASTLTMQLAKNLLLYKEVHQEEVERKRSLTRKLKEYILVQALEEHLSKDEILEWYLNTINFGRYSQGIVMAAKSYFGKELKELNHQEIAFLVALPKAPHNYDPRKGEEFKKKAENRRRKVLREMRSKKIITTEEYKAAVQSEIETLPRQNPRSIGGYNIHYLNAVEKQVGAWLKSKGQSLGLGMEIITPIRQDYQQWAVESLQRGLLRYERAHGTLTIKPETDRLPNIKERVEKLAAEQGKSNMEVFAEALNTVKNYYPDAAQFQVGVVLGENTLGLKSGEVVNRHQNDRKGKRYKLVKGKKRDFRVWDTVLLQSFKVKEGIVYRMASYTDLQGALVVIDNATGQVLATAGRFSVGVGAKDRGAGGNYAFTRGRQVGSTIKPLIYYEAMMRGLSPLKALPDQNLSIPSRKVGGRKLCDPYVLTDKGSSYLTLRQGLERSRNRVTVNTFLSSLGVSAGGNLGPYRAQIEQGIDDYLKAFKSFGIYESLETPCYPILIGSYEEKLVKMTNAISVLANAGVYHQHSTVLSAVRNGVPLNPFNQISAVDAAVQKISRESDPSYARQNANLFRVKTMMQGVVKRGTAKSIKEWGDLIAGKTGTTNDYKDAWFIGFNNDITVGVWVGYPTGRKMVYKSEGAKVALPIFKDFMDQYFAKFPEKKSEKLELNPPSSLQLVYVEPTTGFLINSEFRNDYVRFTGRSSGPGGVSEYLLPEETEQLSQYYSNSRRAGELFYSKMTKSKRAAYASQAQAQYAGGGYYVSRETYEWNRVRCETWVAQGYSPYDPYSQVKQVCDFIRNHQPMPNVDVKSYFLNVHDFNY